MSASLRDVRYWVKDSVEFFCESLQQMQTGDFHRAAYLLDHADQSIKRAEEYLEVVSHGL